MTSRAYCLKFFLGLYLAEEVNKLRILLVEDEVKITDAVAYILKQNNMDVDVANDGDTGLLMAEREIYDVIVLDIMLPGKNGLEILQHIRRSGSNTPVLLLTARDTVQDRVGGLDSGADDYLVKPFAMAELLARIRALSRRIQASYTGKKLTVANLQLDINSLNLRIDSEDIQLSLKEAHILELLMRRPGMVLTRDQILDRVWGYDAEVQENNVEIYIHHLRKKMGNQSNMAIFTIRGVGYTLKEI